MRIVVALGGNALLKRGEPLTAENQRRNVREAARALAPLARGEHQIVISHGNGPQVGLLSLQAASYKEVEPYPLDVLGAQTEGMIGYMIEQELGNILPFEQPFASILTMVEVSPADPAFKKPTKPIGPVYTEQEAKRLAKDRGWTVRRGGKRWQRVVPSPLPQRIFQLRPIKWLLEKGVIVICTGGGGIPTMYNDEGNLVGAEVVIDKDLASALLAKELEADMLVLATDVDAVYRDWRKKTQAPIRNATCTDLQGIEFAEGSMRPKVIAAAWFAEASRQRAAIGALSDVDKLVAGEAGTIIGPTGERPKTVFGVPVKLRP